jgi:hypothetical protein
MNASSSEIDDALRSRQHIARENFVRWSESASELETLDKLHYLAGTAYDRIQPELGLNVACTLALRYFLECVKTNVQHSGMIESRFGATKSLLDWFYHLAEMNEGQSAILTQLRRQSPSCTWQAIVKCKTQLKTGCLSMHLRSLL